MLSLRGDVNFLKMYGFKGLIDISEYDLSDSFDLEKFKQKVAELFDAGELEAINLPEELMGLILDSTEVEFENKSVDVESLELENVDINKLICDNFEVDDTFLLLKGSAEGYFEYDIEDNLDSLKIGYVACDVYLPQEPIYDFFCDLVLPNRLKIKDEIVEISAKNIYPKDELDAQVYKVVEGESGKYLEKIVDVELLRESWDSFEDLIQVDYDSND